MQRWDYIESILLGKSWCLFNDYAISRAIGFQSTIIMLQARLAASLSQTLPQAGTQATPSGSRQQPLAHPPLHHVTTAREQGPSDTACGFLGPCHSSSVVLQ